MCGTIPSLEIFSLANRDCSTDDKAASLERGDGV
jgi:hypothetical protein